MLVQLWLPHRILYQLEHSSGGEWNQWRAADPAPYLWPCSWFLLVTGPLGGRKSQNYNEEYLSLLPPCGHSDCICWLLLPTPHSSTQVPNTQQLNCNIQISHVGHGKSFQVPSPSQLDFASVACAVFLLCRKSLHHFLWGTRATFLCVTSQLYSMHKLWWIST